MNFSIIDLSIRDKRVYEALLKSPQSSVRKIADTTSINRGSVFESIKELVKAGLVTHTVIGKRTVYRAKDPEAINEIISEKQQQLLIAKHTVADYAAALSNHADDHARIHFTSSYEGREGLAAILRDVLKTCRRDGVNEYHAISSPKVSAYLYDNFPHFTRERIRQRLAVRVLRQGKPLRDLADYATTRYIAKLSGDTSCYTLIYSTKVALITIDDHNATNGVIIDNKHFADIQRHLFDISWQNSHENTSS